MTRKSCAGLFMLGVYTFRTVDTSTGFLTCGSMRILSGRPFVSVKKLEPECA